MCCLDFDDIKPYLQYMKYTAQIYKKEKQKCIQKMCIILTISKIMCMPLITQHKYTYDINTKRCIIKTLVKFVRTQKLQKTFNMHHLGFR